jgi:DNA-binding transcriptional ArsR family regulator
MDLLERIQQQINERVAELQPLAVEYKRLQEAYAALGDADRRDIQRSAAAASAPQGARAPRGSARELILAAATQDPEAKRGDIARATGLSPNTVGTTLSKLRAEGLLPRAARSHSAGDSGGHTPASRDDATDDQQDAEVPSGQDLGDAATAETGTHDTAAVGSEGPTGVKDATTRRSARPPRRRRATKAATE